MSIVDTLHEQTLMSLLHIPSEGDKIQGYDPQDVPQILEALRRYLMDQENNFYAPNAKLEQLKDGTLQLSAPEGYIGSSIRRALYIFDSYGRLIQVRELLKYDNTTDLIDAHVTYNPDGSVIESTFTNNIKYHGNIIKECQKFAILWLGEQYSAQVPDTTEKIREFFGKMDIPNQLILGTPSRTTEKQIIRIAFTDDLQRKVVVRVNEEEDLLEITVYGEKSQETLTIDRQGNIQRESTTED